MKKLILAIVFFVLLISFSSAQKPHKIVFCNLENFFDTINDPQLHDDEFTPEGSKKMPSIAYSVMQANPDQLYSANGQLFKEFLAGISFASGKPS